MTKTFDEEVAGAFAARVMGMASDAAVVLQISIAHQTGLFETMAGLPPTTSAEIAAKAGLTERYVRECLAALVAGRVVTYDQDSRTYALPPEHAHSLTTAGGPENLARLTQFITLLATVEEPVVEAFRTGGGVPYSAYPRFQRLMAEDSAAVLDASLLSDVLPLVDSLPARLAAGVDVLDVGCGQGHAVNLLARAFPASRVAGYDLSPEGIAAGRAEAAAWGLANARFEVRDAASLGEEGAYDLVTAFDAIHDQAFPRQVLAGIARALRPDGVFLMVDINASSRLEENLDVLWAPFLYTASTMHCMTVSLAQGGEGLGTMWGRQLACSLLAEAGFASVRVEEIDGDPFNAYYVARR